MDPIRVIIGDVITDQTAQMNLVKDDGLLFILLLILHLMSKVHEVHSNPPRGDERGVMDPFSVRKADPCH
jgi:hypothetical protein